MLNADQLGQKGQARFAKICSDAELICNPAVYDRSGWDFIVEFPHYQPSEHARSTLDGRHSPLSCHVQLKTMWVSNDEFKMRLSAAERLAKEPKPAFVYVFKVDKKLKFVSAYLVHLLDENLAKILKRLRREQAKGADAITKINRKYITFGASRSGQLLTPTGKAFSYEVRKLVGADPNSYIQRKHEQLKNLGFDLRPYEANATLRFGNHEELVDAFLGLKPAELTKLEVSETRFGIRLPASKLEFDKGTLHSRQG